MYNKVSQKGFTNLIRRIIKEEMEEMEFQAPEESGYEKWHKNAIEKLIAVSKAWNEVPEVIQKQITRDYNYNPDAIFDKIQELKSKFS